MALALYRKYRPPTFADVSGQEHIKITLENELASGKIAHAYLFNGPRGTGKTTMARILAKALNCENRQPGQSEPCNQCAACQAINAGSSLDVVEIDAASNRGVDNVQNNIINYIRVRPSQHKYRVFIIDEVHMLTSYAFNALLKTLEEPPEYVVFILATTEVHKILPTIISRCQRFDFKKLDSAVIKKRLMMLAGNEGVKVADAVLDLVIHYSEGCMRDAESLLSQILSLDEKEVSLEQAQLVLPRSDLTESFNLLECIFQNRLEAALALLNHLVTQGLDIEQFYKEFIVLLRQLLMLKLKVGTVLDLPLDQTEKLEKLMSCISVNQLMKLINLFVMIPSQYKTTVIPQLPFEVALVSAVHALFPPEGIEKPENNQSNNQANQVSNQVNQASNQVNQAPNQAPNQASNQANHATEMAENIVEAITEENQVNQVSNHDNQASNQANQLDNQVNQVDNQANQVSNQVSTIQTINNEEVVINIELLKKRWGDVRNVLKKDNISLASLITVAAPRLSKGKLAVVFRYQFNFDHVNRNAEMQNLISQAIAAVLGYKCAVLFQCDPAVVLLDQTNYHSEDNLSTNNTANVNNANNSFFDILGVEQLG